MNKYPLRFLHSRTRRLRCVALHLASTLLIAALPTAGSAQTPINNERFVPADELETVFEHSPAGILLQKDEYNDLLQRAKAAVQAANAIPDSLVLRSAEYTIKPSGNHALVTLVLDLEQFADSWQTLQIPTSNLLPERATVGHEPAIIGRKSDSELEFFHREPGRVRLTLHLSTALGRVASDRVASFDLIGGTPVQLKIECPAGQYLLLGNRRLGRPESIAQPTTYTLPVNAGETVQLQWTTRRNTGAAETLVFVRSDVQMQLSSDTMHWNADSRITVFGGTINRITTAVPSGLEITSVESSGLESWELSDDPDRSGHTLTTLTWRQPFSQDRLVRMSGVAALAAGTTERVPAHIFNEITAHTGRVSIVHEDQLRLLANVGSGIRQLEPDENANDTSGTVVFDYWKEDFDLSIVVRPRDRELFSELTSHLSVSDTEAVLSATVTIETLNAPLFGVSLVTPSGWQILELTGGAENPIRWRTGDEEGQLTVEPSRPVAPNELLELELRLRTGINDPATQQRLTLPVIRAMEATTVTGRYTIQSSPDLQTAPVDIRGLIPVAEASDAIVFEAQGTEISGALTIERRPVRLSARSEIRTWMDARNTTSTVIFTVDITNGTTRTLSVRIPENTGDDLRFTVTGIGPVPGFDDAHSLNQLIPEQITIAETTSDDPVDGQRLWHLTFDRRAAGSITLRTRMHQPRDRDVLTAPTIEIPRAIHQQGLIVFEAQPNQQFDPANNESLIGLRPADPGLVPVPDASTGRRVARVYQFVCPRYSGSLSETRFDTQVVPTAICRHIQNISLLSDSGSIQRSCRILLHCIGVQTLRFTLPQTENVFLWSTILNGEAIEVRRDGDHYLVAIPTGDARTDHELEILFESQVESSAALSGTPQESVLIAIDADGGQAVPIDVLEQSWQMQYPRDSLLLDHSGGFHPMTDLDEAGWLRALSRALRLPTLEQLKSRGFFAGGILAILLIATILIVRRRWLALAVGFPAALLVTVFVLLPEIQNTRGIDLQTISQGNLRQTGIALNAATSEAFDEQLTDSDRAGYFEGREGDPGFSERGLGRWSMDGVDSEAIAEFEGLSVDERAEILSEQREDLDVSQFSDAAGTLGAPMRGGRGLGGGGLGGGMPAMGGLPGAPAGTFGNDRIGNRARNPAEDVLGRQLESTNGAAQESLSGNENSDGHLPGTEGEVGLDSSLRLQSQFGTADTAGKAAELFSRRGKARLSVRVDLQSPEDYHSTEFLSVGGSASERRLTIVLRKAEHLSVIRALAALVALIVCWRLRNRTLAVRISIVAVLILPALALVPLATSQWQAAIDGVVLGTLSAVLLWPASRLLSVIQRRCGQRRTAQIAAGLLFLSVSQSAVFAKDKSSAPPPTEASSETTPDIVLPYFPDTPPLAADKVMIPRETFLRLYEQAYPHKIRPETAPADSMVVAAFYRSESRRQIDDSGWSQTFKVRYVIRSFDDGPVQVALPIRSVAVRSAELNGNQAVVLPSQSRYTVRIPKIGLHVLDLTFDVPATVQSSAGSVELETSVVPTGTLTFDLPEDDLEVRVNGRTNTFRREGRRVVVPMNSASRLHLQWQPRFSRSATDIVLHTNVNSALDFSDEGLILTSAVELRPRQGQPAEVTVTLPAGYSVQVVDGAEIAGWRVVDNETDSGPALKITFRRPLEDNATLQLTLFSRQIITSDRCSIRVPIPGIPAASRSTGTVCVLAGDELEVRTESLSGVSQINSSDAVLPQHFQERRPRVLAWRYTRHPAEISVRASRVSDYLETLSNHGVQLQSERQLWTSFFDVTIHGAPRRRMDIHIPRSFLAVEVDSPDLDDWYVTEPEDDSDITKHLSLQLRVPRSGKLHIVVHGQNERARDRAVESIDVPALDGADEAATRLSVWLDAASEINDVLTNGWTPIAPAETTDELRALQPRSADISFRSKQPLPGTIALSLRNAAASLIGESVTVSNITDTSIERTLGLSWQISRASADALSVELPSEVTRTLDFQVPGLRQEERVPVNGDRVRITFHLQFPVSEQFFVAGIGAVPLPDSGVFGSIPVTFVAGDAVHNQTTIAGQSHFWVIVNQSNGILASVNPDDDTENVTADQIRTILPEGFLKQSVAIRRITEQQPGSAWNVRFPESQATTPTVISLAQHVTILSDDGTWRSRHALQVRNESRQFFPVVLPEDSRPLYCLVKNRPARIVARPGEDSTLHLIPIPQSGQVSSAFTVELAIAGTLSESADTIHERWQQRQIQIPVPRFPEYRDDAELGVTVARNTWSVYVPKTWLSELDDNPQNSNLVPADNRALEDAVLMTLVDNTRSMLSTMSLSTQSLSVLSRGLYDELQTQRDVLAQQRGNSRAAEQNRFQTLGELDEYLKKNAPPARAITGTPQSGRESQKDGPTNYFLEEEALIRNKYNNTNNLDLITGNTAGAVDFFQQYQSGQAELAFRFVIPEGEKKLRDLKKSQRSRPQEPKQRWERQRRSQLLQKKSGQKGITDQLGALIDGFNRPHRLSRQPDPQQPNAPVPMFGGGARGRRTDEAPVAQSQPTDSPSGTAQDAESQSQTVLNRLRDELPTSADQLVNVRPTGLLSLRFEIPTDGERFDFVRAGGNARLTLKVRSSQAHERLLGILWAATCAAAIVLILRSVNGGDQRSLLTRTLLLAATVGLAGWFFVPGASGQLALFFGLASIIVICLSAIVHSYRKPPSL